MLSFYFNKIHSLINKKSDLILNISLLLSVIYFIIRSIDCLFLIPFPIGDERVFVKEFIYLIENGFSQTIQKGTSFFYISFSFFISLITGLETFSLRIVSFISTLLLIFYFLLRISFDDLNSKKLFFTLLLFLIPTTGAAIHGTNDSMFFLFLIIFVFELIIFDKSKNNNKYLLILSSTFMIVTRPVIIVYTGSLIISLAFYSIIDRNVYLKSILKKYFSNIYNWFFYLFPNFIS